MQGAWNTDEQHIAPVLGLIAHVIERDRIARAGDGLRLSRISYDILGVLPIAEVEIAVRVLRPGRTIELVEATLSHDGRPAVLARAWFLAAGDTTQIAGSALPPFPADGFQPWDGSTVWPGAFIGEAQVDWIPDEPGRARFRVHPTVPLLADEPVSATARTLGFLDIANGISPRLRPEDAHYPNVDLTAHLFREPSGAWIGYDTAVSFGPDGRGLTHTVLHDEHGPFGTSSQSLTVRPR